MRVGVVMPTYRQAKFLPKALEAYDAQTYRDSFLVAVDDGSLDETAMVLINNLHLDRGIIVTHPENRGTAAAINTGVETLCSKAWDSGFEALTWISSDNAMTQDWLEVLVGAMRAQAAGVVYGGFWWENEARRLYLFRPYDPATLISDQNCFFGPAFLIRRDVWLEAGGHRGKISHDYDHWLRVEEVCWRRGLPIVGVDRGLCHYSAHGERVTVTRAHEYDAHLWQAEAGKRRGGV